MLTEVQEMPLTMDRRNKMICLFDCYSNLLTEKQKSLFNYYFNEDLSLAEISSIMGISRQAVHNSIGRCEEALEEYEAALGIYRRSMEVDNVLAYATALIEESIKSGEWPLASYEDLLARLRITRKAD